MPKPVLYGSLISPPVQTVMYTAKAIGLELELKEIDVHGSMEHLSDDFVKINPQHTVPTLVDNGVSIWDSNAIIIYLVDKYGKDDSLYPKDLSVRARIHQRLFFGAGAFDKSYHDVLVKQVKPDKTITEEESEAMLKQLDFLESFLVDDYLIGNTVSIADLALILRILIVLRIFPISSANFPRIFGYVERLRSWKDFNAIQEAADHIFKYIEEFKIDLANKVI